MAQGEHQKVKLYIGGEWERNGRRLFLPVNFAIPDTLTAYRRFAPKRLSLIANQAKNALNSARENT